MAKGAWIGVGGKARKIKNMYIGIGGKARKIKKAWIGVGGKARLFFSSEATYTKYTGTISGLNLTSIHTAVSNGNYAFFRGSSYNDKEDRTFINVTAYNASLTKKSPTAPYFNDDRRGTCLGQNSKYIVVNGGRRDRNMTYFSKYMDCYDASLTKTLMSSAAGRVEYHVSDTIGDNILFVGGSTGSGNTGTSAVIGYNSSLTSISGIASLSTARYRFTFHGRVGNYAVFAGGQSGGNSKTNVDGYNASLTRTAGTALPTAIDCNSINNCCNSSYMICTRGYWNSASADCTTYAINSSLTVSSPAKPTYTPYEGTGASTPDCAVIISGYKSTGVGRNTVEGWNTSLTKVSLPNLTTGRLNAGAAMIGDYLLVGGGSIDYDNDSDPSRNIYTNTVEAYTIS